MGLMVEPSLGQVSYPAAGARAAQASVGPRMWKEFIAQGTGNYTIGSVRWGSCEAAQTSGKWLLWDLAFVSWLLLNLINNKTHTHMHTKTKSERI